MSRPHQRKTNPPPAIRTADYTGECRRESGGELLRSELNKLKTHDAYGEYENSTYNLMCEFMRDPVRRGQYALRRIITAFANNHLWRARLTGDIQQDAEVIFNIFSAQANGEGITQGYMRSALRLIYDRAGCTKIPNTLTLIA